MKTLYYCLPLLIVGCGDDGYNQCTFKTSGLCIRTNGLEVDKEDIDTTVRIMEEALEAHFNDEFDLVRMYKDDQVIVEFTDANMMFKCKQIDKKAPKVYECRDISGIIFGNNIVFVEHEKCLGYTAFAHELLHNFEENVLGIKKSNHELPLFNSEIKYRSEALENVIRRESVKKLNSCKRGS